MTGTTSRRYGWTGFACTKDYLQSLAQTPKLLARSAHAEVVAAELHLPLCGPDAAYSCALRTAHFLHFIIIMLLYNCACRVGYVRDPETQMADKAASGTELTKVSACHARCQHTVGLHKHIRCCLHVALPDFGSLEQLLCKHTWCCVLTKLSSVICGLWFCSAVPQLVRCSSSSNGNSTGRWTAAVAA
jgi:hypothetical protein